MTPAFVYNTVLWLGSPLLALYYLYTAVLRGKTRRGWKQQLGIHDRAALSAQLTGAPRIWIHAVSVGEAMAAAALVEALRAELPGASLIVSTTTDTGQDTANKQLSGIDALIYFPFDFGFAVRGALAAVKPDVFVMIETELWPNMLHLCKRQGVATLLANGRMSDRNMQTWRYLGPFMRWLFGQVDVFAMRSEFDAERLQAHALPPERIYVTGEIKMDQPLTRLDDEARAALRAELRLAEDERLILAGSTHPGEEQQVLEAFWRVRMNHPKARLMLAPRHLERIDEVAAAIEAAGFRPRRKTELAAEEEAGSSSEDKVLLLDTMGELANLYGACDLAFIGGSLVQRGGHNVLEPAIQGCPVLFGPHMQNFRSLAELLCNTKVAFQVKDAAELSDRLCELLDTPQRLAKIADQAAAVIAENRGASKRDARLIAQLAEGWRP